MLYYRVFQGMLEVDWPVKIKKEIGKFLFNVILQKLTIVVNNGSMER